MRKHRQDCAVLRSQMFADPDLTGKQLEWALATLEILECGEKYKVAAADRLKSRQTGWIYTAMKLAGITDESMSDADCNGRLHSLIDPDVPKYRAPNPTVRECFGEKLRPLGDPCGARVSSWSMVPNALNGEHYQLATCSNKRHQSEYLQRERDAWKAWRENGSPQPPHNSGGVLAKHLGDSNMARLYEWCRNYYKPKPETSAEEEPEVGNLAPVISLAERKK